MFPRKLSGFGAAVEFRTFAALRLCVRFFVFLPSQLGKGVMEIRSGGVMKARGAAYASFSQELAGHINSAFLMPMLRYSPGSITPIFSEDPEQKISRKADFASSPPFSFVGQGRQDAKEDRRTEKFHSEVTKATKTKFLSL
jgi:hypothetical protein